MTELPAPVAPRIRRPSWRDSRLLVGILIILASVALGSWAVASADDTVPVYAAATTMSSGRVVDASDLMVVRVRLAPGTADYLSAARPLPADSVLLRAVGEGELVPASAVGDSGRLTRRPVSIPLGAPAPADLRPGVRVDLWSSAKDATAGSTVGSAAYRPPVRLSQNAEVYAVTSGGSGLSVTQGAAVQVLLGESQLRAVLDALANGARLAVVPLPGTAPGKVGG